MRKRCLHCDAGTQHEQWAVLLWSPHSSTWDYGRQPAWKLRCHNRDRHFIRGQKSTKYGSPNHVNAMIVGPFKKHACMFVRIMRANNRKYRNRLVRGVHLAQVWRMIDPHQIKPLSIYVPDAAHRTCVLNMLRGQSISTEEGSTKNMMKATASLFDNASLIQHDHDLLRIHPTWSTCLDIDASISELNKRMKQCVQANPCETSKSIAHNHITWMKWQRQPMIEWLLRDTIV